MSQLYIVTLIPQLTCVVHLVTCQTGWFTCWNQDRWEKHKKTQLFRWYHSNGRKWKGIKNLYTRVKEESKRAGSKLNIKNLRSWILVPSLHGKKIGKKWKQWQILFPWGLKSLQSMTTATKLKDTCSLKEKLWQPWQHRKKQRHHFVDKGPYSQSYGFSRSHV